tara:strand:- start:105 stop:338 length:234 start_codon:yes stop_codon:yes gene_type:complete
VVDIAEGFSGVPGGAGGGIGVEVEVEYKKWLGEEACFWATVWATVWATDVWATEKKIGKIGNTFKIFNSPFLITPLF